MLLFDVDGTLTLPRQKISNDMVNVLIKSKEKYKLGIVSTSDEKKIKEQLNEYLYLFDYIFYENGLMYYKNNNLIHQHSIYNYISKEDINSFTIHVLELINQLDLPFKNSKFIEIRNSLINISPVGRDSTIEQRNEFEKYDSIYKIRNNLIDKLKDKFKNLNLEFCIGGQISFDVYPTGLDKSFCLQFINENDKPIHFFGDKTDEGGNDYKIYINSSVIGHKVNSYFETINQLNLLLN